MGEEQEGEEEQEGGGLNEHCKETDKKLEEYKIFNFQWELQVNLIFRRTFPLF